MAFLYLSPSTQEYNPYINTGNEEYYMNLIADQLEPFLRASGISFTRNTPEMTAAISGVLRVKEMPLALRKGSS